jgi:signal transduction histidine kinase
LREIYKILVTSTLVIAACFLTYYFFIVLKTDIIFTHFFYIPIILAALWFKKKGIFVTIFLTALLISTNFIFPSATINPINDCIRVVMFFVISLVSIKLSLTFIEREKYREAYNRAELYKDLLSHDINNFLQSISLSTECCLANLTSPDQLSKDLSNILNQIKSSAQLISNVRLLSELEKNAPKVERKEIYTTLQEAIDLVKQSFPEREIDIQVQPSTGEVFVQANTFLVNVFSNILNNAVKYCQEPKAVILIRISKKEEEGGRYICLEFIDNGIGIPDIRKKSIFQRAYAKDRSITGLGIGLSLIKGFIVSCHGKIWVEDKVSGNFQKGSKFITMIPEDT